MQLRELVKTKQYDILLEKLESAVATLDRNNPDSLAKHSKYLTQIPKALFIEKGYLHKRMVVMGGYTTELITPLIRWALFERGLIVEVIETDYGSLESIIRAQEEGLAKFEPDLLYFCVGTEHLNLNDPEGEVQRWNSLWELARQWLGCDIIQNTFEEPLHRIYANYECRYEGSDTQKVQKINQSLSKSAPSYVHFSDVNYLSSFYGKDRWRDEKFYDLSKTPVAYDYLWPYAKSCADVASQLYGKSKKCLVLDLDNTLWGGVIGDDGLAGIRLGEGSGEGEAYKRFQTYIKGLKDRGVILAVCSKNEEDNAKEPFTASPEMVLRLEDISCFVANWDPKDLNLKRIAAELNIGLDSMVFVDDNPAEREKVRQGCPEVAVIELDSDPATYTKALSRCGYFETNGVTDEDRNRTKQYRANAQRKQLLSTITNYGAYLKTLEHRAVIAPFDSLNLTRITQLINKTNQFNLTTKRYRQQEVEAMTAETQGHLTRYVRLRDKFGDNGIISVLIAKAIQAEVYQIDTWLMSCRVLKRNVEQALLANVVETLKKDGVKWLHGEYRPTKKNKMVENLFASFGFSLAEERADGSRHWSLDLSDSKAVKGITEPDFFIKTVPPDHY